MKPVASRVASGFYDFAIAARVTQGSRDGSPPAKSDLSAIIALDAWTAE